MADYQAIDMLSLPTDAYASDLAVIAPYESVEMVFDFAAVAKVTAASKTALPTVGNRTVFPTAT